MKRLFRYTRGVWYLFPYQIVYLLLLLLLTFFVINLYFDMERSFQSVKRQFVNYESLSIEEFARNIERKLQKAVSDDPLRAVAQNPDIQRILDETLSLFSTRYFRYVYILYLDKNGKLRYLADGSYEEEERGLPGQKFDPDSPVWYEALKNGRPAHAIQNDFTGLWITYYYPLKIWQSHRFLLVFDVSMETLENFKQLMVPFRDLLRNVSIVLVILLAMSVVWATLFYLQRKRNNVDPLTKLYNRNVLKEIQKYINLGRTSVILADIDHFKRINDRYGHDVGDMVLQIAARNLMRATRAEDIIVRYGGEEFLILINDVKNREEVVQIAYRIHNTFNRHPIRYGGHELQVTLSMGVVPTPGKEIDLSAALLIADKMLYIAKTTGRNKVVVYGDETIRRPMLYNEVLDALRQERLVYLFQPIFESRSMRIEKYEVLARLQDKEGFIHTPDEFIPTIRGTNAYRIMSKALISHVFETIRRHKVHLSINFDINDFLDETLFETIFDTLQQNRAYSDYLTIELLEDNPVHNLEFFVKKVERLKELGIAIAIDDYGKGYAGLAYVLNFRPQILKVDHTLVNQIFTHPHAEPILRSIVQTCHQIGIRAVAEGIEDAKTCRAMMEIGFDALQGHFLGKPDKEIKNDKEVTIQCR